jgi:hypothetical protein
MKYMPNQIDIYKNLMISDLPKQAIHIAWGDLDNIFTELLTMLLGRTIKINAKREEFYYWCTELSEPISKEELETLFSIVEADELEQEQNEFDEYPLLELSEGLCKKLINKLLVFNLEHTRADDEGVWFIGN